MPVFLDFNCEVHIVAVAPDPTLIGHVSLKTARPPIAGSYCSLELKYRCGKYGVDDLGGLAVCFRSANDQTPLQTAAPSAPGYITAEASNGAALDIKYDPRGFVRPWYKALFIRTKQFLKEGDMITVRIGDTRQGSPGLRLQTFCEHRFKLKVLVDPIATGEFVELKDSPTLTISPDQPRNWKLVTPTDIEPWEIFRLNIKAEDAWGNPADLSGQIIGLRSDSEINGLPDRIRFKESARYMTVSGLSAAEASDIVIEAFDPITGQSLALSNPLRVRTQTSLRRYWSDLHGQTEETIGTNTAREYFEFARDLSFLDICGHQGNDFQITDEFWYELNQLTAEFNEPGRFVTLPGYEWSGNTGVGGDHNVWYRYEGRPIFRSSRALIDRQSEQNRDCVTAADLFAALRDENALVTAHCGGRYADVRYAHDGKIEPSVEIHSCWGTFEWIVRDAFEQGYRVGIVGASDGHKGRPGSSYPGASKFGAYGGHTGHLLAELSRDALFESFRRRHHYATTGARIWLETSASFETDADIFHGNPDYGPTVSEQQDSAIMGDIVRISDDLFKFNVSVIGTAPIERIELREGLDTLEVLRPYDRSDLGRRIRIIWEGAESRGRGRAAVWDGDATIRGNRVDRLKAINFWNVERLPRLVDDTRVEWSSFTTGSFAGIDLLLEDADAGRLKVSAQAISFELDIAEIGFEDTIFPAGGLGKQLRVYRLPDANPRASMSFSSIIRVRERHDTRPYVCVTQEDGHRAWSSPIYVFKE